MLTYTFSTREKIMLAILAFVGVGILWYKFVFSNIQGQVAQIDSQIAQAQDELLVAQSQAASAQNMKKLLEDYQKRGIKAPVVPEYDNTQKLMAYLNGVLGGTQGYTINFDDPTLDENDGNVHRAGTITFNSNSYAEARSVVDSIARGTYSCRIDALGIADDTSKQSSGSNNSAPVVTNVQVTYFEKPSSDTVVSTDDGIPEGNDWSVYTNNNK
ncbi:MAG: hypothetical protein Q4A01_08425 [Coriobacteriales bacterium]|nr:hypothetical protein [Coriobacteriales bacterium]